MSAETGWAVDIYIDGVCSGDSGPGGWGALLKYGYHEKRLSGGEASATTRRRMELNALIRAFESLTRPCEVHVYTGRPVHLEKPVENVDLWRELGTAKGCHVTPVSGCSADS